jgi:hypothetical protein
VSSFTVPTHRNQLTIEAYLGDDHNCTELEIMREDSQYGNKDRLFMFQSGMQSRVRDG